MTKLAGITLLQGLIAGSAVVGAGAGVAGVVQSRSVRKDAEKQFKKQEAETAAKLEETRKAEAQAKVTANKKAAARELAVETGGRPSTFAADAFGLRTPANISKKKLG